MKNRILHIIVVFMLVLGSCDFLGYNEEDFYGEDLIFENFDRTKGFLNNLYNKLPSGFNEIGGSMRASATDDAVEANSVASIQTTNEGRWSPTQPFDDNWGSMYEGIRAANKLLKNADLSVLDDRRFNDNYPELVKEFVLFDDQARFLRAFFYFELMRRYGGVPLLYGQILSLDEVNEVQHSSFEEVKDFIVSECNAVMANLPVDYTNVPGRNNKGRVTKGAAMALKARVLLYAASPLHNPGNDLSKWEDAAEAAGAIIDSATTKGWYALESSYENVVNNSESPELIMGIRSQASRSFEASNFPVGYEGANPGTCPTQNLVDTYEMVNGRDIDEQFSLYDPDNPYQYRDPRLEQTIVYNNSTWKGRNVELWRGGLDGLPIERASKTGYYLKKYVEEIVSLDPDAPVSAEHLWVFYRYGEVLLNFAEAMNEAYGPDADPEGYGMTAADAMNQIRNRAGLPDYAGSMTKDDFRRELREERRVELAFENHRFWDIRRWKIGEQTTEIKGMEIIKGNGTFNYNITTIETRPWDNKMYLFPIPQTEIFKNDNLNQNPGW